jgi:hypothetical protein
MTRRSQVEVRCPECALQQSVGTFHSVNVTLDPDLRERLFADDVNVFSMQELKHYVVFRERLADRRGRP